MNIHEKYIKRCLELAKNGLGNTTPNPSVGCVIVLNGKIIGEGYTSSYGGNHAEVNAIHSVKDKSQLKDATIYVSLEPCNHFGKTPPCSDLIVKHRLKNVVVGCIDPYREVAGKGIQKLRDNGINVKVGVLENECLESNKHFFTYHTQKRPYIILKWAETVDGFIDIDRKVDSLDGAKPNWITNKYSRQLVHKWRSQEDAILVGTNTVINDNPELNVRDWSGTDPVRVVLDRSLRVSEDYHIYDSSTKTIVLTEEERTSSEEFFFEKVDFDKNLGKQICSILYNHKILSVIIEGGKQTLETFINENLWDEARIFVGASTFIKGVNAPNVNGDLIYETIIDNDTLKLFKNRL